MTADYLTRCIGSFDTLDSRLNGIREAELVRSVKTEDKVKRRQSHIISLDYFLEVPEAGFKEKYFTIDAPIQGTETPEGYETVVNHPCSHTEKDARLSSIAIIEERARAAAMVEFLQRKGIKVNYGAGFEAGFDAEKALHEAARLGFCRKELMRYRVLSEYLHDCVSQAVRNEIIL